MRTATLGEVCEFKPSKRLARASLSESDAVSFVPMSDLGIHQKFIGRHEQRPLSEVIGSYTYFAEGDVLLAKITPCFENGKLGVARELTNGVGFGSSEFTVIRPSNQILAEYIYYFLDRDEVRLQGAKVMTGAVGHKRVPQKFIEALEIPLPPLEEQRRIVAVLDEAFAAIATATANAQKNLANARDLFASELDALIIEAQSSFPSGPLIDQCVGLTVGHVGPMKDRYQPDGIPFLRSQNVRPFEISFDGMTFIDEQFDGELKKSRLRPGDVAVVRTGYPGTAAVIPATLPHANCSDLVIIRPGKTLNPHFVTAFLNSNIGKRAVSGELVGAAQKHFNVGSAKKVAIPLPSLDEQTALLDRVSAFSNLADQLIELSKDRLRQLAALKLSVSHRAFSGKLALSKPVIPMPANDDFASPKGSAQIIALAYWFHKKANRDKSYKHVKAQKCLHNIENIGAINLGRSPRKFPYGPHDPSHMAQAESWARENAFFEFVPSQSGPGLDFNKLANYETLLAEARSKAKPFEAAILRAIEPLVPMNMEEAELFATVHAAWNNLLLNGAAITDDAIVKEARDDWDSAKLSIPRQKFLDTIKLIRAKRMAPEGTGKYVGGGQASLF